MASSPTKAHRVPPNGDKGQNIQVFVRCRPLNDTEKAQRSYSVVDTPNSKEITIKEKATSSLTKTFQFDKVFGIKSKQLEVYRSVVEPLIGQVMQGYNCTVFAYGQTGTGKTFTMEGGDGRDDPNMTWENDPTAGIIPRALAQLFDELRMQQDAEFSVRVSFLELYNEDIFDLLSATDDLTKLRLYEDSARKGSVIIQGLEEVQVQGKKEVYNILERGSKKRQTAATLMNAHSSRSHTIFTVTVHMKESNGVDGEEVLRIGKLNLVDLAGSENVGRSGAVDKRAREAGNINQSLLTLGRVITCLVERTPHIPYRESKLTRLLQDSLGGRTKTSIIATVSPAGINLEETLSTLDYAHRAKNITNKPEVNQRMSKKAVLKEYTEEIERLRKDLMASREKNGVFLEHSNYQSMIAKSEATEQELAEKLGQLKALEEEMAKKEQMFEEVSAELEVKTEELEATTEKLAETEHSLECTRTVLHKTAVEKEEQKHLVEKHQETEVKLGGQAKKLLEVAEVTTKEGAFLHDKLDRIKGVEQKNKEAKLDFKEVFSANIDELVEVMENHTTEQTYSCATLRSKLKDQLEARINNLTSLSNQVEELASGQVEVLVEMEKKRGEMAEEEEQFIAQQAAEVQKVIQEERQASEEFKNIKMRPLLEQVASIVKTQVEELEKLREVVERDVVGLVTKVEAWSQETVSSLTHIKSEVEKYASSNEQRMEKVQAKNKEIIDSEASVKALLGALVEGYGKHAAQVAGSTNAIEEETREDLKEAKELVDCSGKVVVKVEEKKRLVQEEINQEKDRISMYVHERTKSCKSNNESVLEKGERLGELTEAQVEATKVRWAAHQESYSERAATHTLRLEEKVADFNKVAKEGEDKLKASGGQLEKTVEEVKDVEEAAVRRLATEVETVGEKCTTTMDSLQSRLNLERDTVVSFVTEVLQDDQPSGLTPQRAERSFPRYLEATSPHQRILHRFRSQAEAAVVAARLPLEDSDTEDSALSSNALSRESSDGDIKIKRASPQDGVARHSSTEGSKSRAESQSSSRSSSRQNSSHDMRVARSSVTSDIGSEINDQENQDPNFRKPAATSQSKRPTGLRKPEVRVRSKTRLGSQNSVN